METTSIATPQVLTYEEIFEHDQFGEIRVRYDDDKNIEINLEDAARGLGLTQTQSKGGKIYTSIRWERVNSYLEEIGFSPKSGGNDGYLPEAFFYMLAMKANNEAARKFQRWIAFEVVPNIRKHGYYAMPTAPVAPEFTPDFFRKIADTLEAKEKEILALTSAKAELEGTVAVQAQKIDEMTPKATFYNLLMCCKDTVTVTTIAKDYKRGAANFNRLLEQLGVQFKQRNRWVLKQEFSDKFEKPDKPLTATKIHPYPDADGKVHTNEYMVWTQAGRVVLYHFLAKHNIFPKVAEPNVEAPENN